MSRRLRFGAFVLAGLAVAALLVTLVAPRASDQPDGLERVALDEGFADTARDHHLAALPTAGFGMRGVDHQGLGTALAGLVGVAVTFTVAGGLLFLVRRSARRREGASTA